MAEAGDGSGHTPLTPEWTPAPRASHYPWQGDRPAAAPSLNLFQVIALTKSGHRADDGKMEGGKAIWIHNDFVAVSESIQYNSPCRALSNQVHCVTDYRSVIERNEAYKYC